MHDRYKFTNLTGQCIYNAFFCLRGGMNIRMKNTLLFSWPRCTDPPMHSWFDFRGVRTETMTGSQ